MLRNLFLLVPFLLLVHVTSVVVLPSCQGSDVSRWHNCKGTYWFTSGKKYVGAFWDGDFNGHGTLTFSSGKLLRND